MILRQGTAVPPPTIIQSIAIVFERVSQNLALVTPF